MAGKLRNVTEFLSYIEKINDDKQTKVNNLSSFDAFFFTISNILNFKNPLSFEVALE